MDAGGSQHAACTVRVVNIYATPWRFNGELDKDGATPDLSGLERHYELYKEQLPQLLPDQAIGKVTLADAVDGVTVNDAKAELFTLPSKQVVLAVTMCLTDSVLTDEQRAKPVAEVLEKCIVGDIKIGDRMVADALSAEFATSPAKDVFSKETHGEPLLPERHQLVFVARSTPEQPMPSTRVINKILYRSAPQYRPEFVHPRWPDQLNSPEQAADADPRGERLTGLPGHRRTDAEQDDSVQLPTLGVVTPYVSLLYGHRKYVEASIFLSTVQAVGTAARFRHIWREAYHQVLRFREEGKLKAVAGQQTRDELEYLADSLGNLEFDLTFSVEFPLLRIETFQTDLYEAMDLGAQATTLSQMFDQLGGSLRSEITAIEVRERRRAESRQKWNSVAAGLLSLIGVPVGFVVAFLSINTTEVQDPKVSMWDAHYEMVYLLASLFALTPVFLIWFPYLKEYVMPRRDRQALWRGLVTGIFGAAMFISALLSDQYQSGRGRIIDAIATAVGAFLIVVGLTLLLLWRVAVRRPLEEVR